MSRTTGGLHRRWHDAASKGALLIWAAWVSACRSESSSPGEDPVPSSSQFFQLPAPAVSLAAEDPPAILYLPTSGDDAPPVASAIPAFATHEFGVPSPSFGAAALHTRCPPEMVEVKGTYCVDRYEAVLVDNAHSRRLSPYYVPSLTDTRRAYDRYRLLRLETGTDRGRTLPVPAPPDWQLVEAFEPRALVRPNQIPNGYVTGNQAALACKNAGKRLCSAAEWITACRGERDQQFPYGSRYENGLCNVFREAHPAQVLYGDPSIHHRDPRLNTVQVGDQPLLRTTGALPRCRSEWGGDAIYDMVGNLDEWVDDEKGAFLGGFFARSTREGCLARVSVHPPGYSDYSLGVRCCRSLGN